MRKKSLILLSAFFLIFVSAAAIAHGEAFRLLGQGNSGTAQGDAFAAQADDPSAIFYNPAGMTQLDGVQFSASTLFVGGHYEYKSPGGANFKGDLNGAIAIPPPTTAYLTAKLDKLGEQLGIDLFDNFALGIGINSPFGLVVNWPQNIPFSSVSTFAQLPLVDLKPTLAYRATDYLSVGMGLDVYTFFGFLGDGKLRARSFIPPNTNIDLNGEATAIGFNLGILVTPWRTKIVDMDKPRLNFAFVYRSAATLNLKGDFLIDGQKTANAAFDLKLPQLFTWGAAVWPIRDKTSEWKVETDLDYVDWSSFKNLDIKLSNGTLLPEPRDWKRVFTVKLGTEYKWIEIPNFRDWDVAMRAGYVRANSPIPEKTFEPSIPISDFNGFSFGVGFTCKGSAMFLGFFRCGNSVTKAIGVDFTYKNQLYESRTIKNNINPVVNGKYDTVLHAGGLGMRISF